MTLMLHKDKFRAHCKILSSLSHYCINMNINAVIFLRSDIAMTDGITATYTSPSTASTLTLDSLAYSADNGADIVCLADFSNPALR